jgi:hypothetical protein
MFWLTEDAVLMCAHESGIVQIEAQQKLLRINGRRVLVEDDPEHKKIEHCPWMSPGQKRCTTTQAVKEGYSPTISVDGHRVCLDTVSGLTDGTPFGTFRYKVRTTGQDLVSQL